MIQTNSRPAASQIEQLQKKKLRSVPPELSPPLSPFCPVTMLFSAAPGPDINPRVDLIWGVWKQALRTCSIISKLFLRRTNRPCLTNSSASVSVMFFSPSYSRKWAYQQTKLCKCACVGSTSPMWRFDSQCPGWWHLVTSITFTVKSRCQLGNVGWVRSSLCNNSLHQNNIRRWLVCGGGRYETAFVQS